MHSDLVAISAHPLFQSLNLTEIQTDLDQGSLRIVRFTKDALIHQEEDPCTKLEVLLAGETGLCRIDEDGRIYTVNTFLPGDVLGGHVLFSRHPNYPLSVMALKDTTILEVKAQLIMDLCQQSPAFLLAFLQLLSDNALVLGTAVKSSRPRSIEEGLKIYLKRLLHQQQSERIRLPMSKKELAERLGVNRSSLSKVFQRLKRQGVLDWQGRTIQLLDTDWGEPK